MLDMINNQADFVVVGAGIVGLTLARELLRRHPRAKIMLLEKEDGIGRHQSGRNSGVLHSGIFYPSDSVKSKVCAEGAKEMQLYCEQNRLPLFACGKIIVPVTAHDADLMNRLYERGRTNGINVHKIDLKRLKELEPDAFSITGEALYLPGISVVDPVAILERLKKELAEQGVDIRFNHRVLKVNPSVKTLTTNNGPILFGFLLNAAGLHAEEISKSCGVGEGYAILPFKGYYYKLQSSRIKVNRLIYALPDPAIPFLGIHAAKKPDGSVFFGPTVVPSFGRENYCGLSDIRFKSSSEILFTLMNLFMKNDQNFRKLVLRDGFRFFKRNFHAQTQKLIPSLKIDELIPSSHLGIRAQLVNIRESKLVLDFLIEKGENSIHVLNAVSPAFTGSLPFARMVLDRASL